MNTITEKQIRQTLDIRKQLSSWTKKTVASNNRALLDKRMLAYIVKHMDFIIEDHMNSGEQDSCLTMANKLLTTMTVDTINQQQMIGRFIRRIENKYRKYDGLKTLKAVHLAKIKHNKVINKKV